MAIADVIAPEGVFTGLSAQSKKQALEVLAEKAASLTGIDQRKIFDGLLQREKLGTTGVGHGVAIPHARIDELDDLTGIFAKFDKPVEFDAVDDEPVDLVCVLLAPESAGAAHLKALAKISRVLRDEDACIKIRAAGDDQSLAAELAA